MGPKGSLCLKVPTTCPYSQPDQSSPSPLPSHFPKIQLNIILHLRLSLPNGLFPSAFPTKTPSALLHAPIWAMCSAHLILPDLFNLIKSGKEYRSLSSSLCSFLHSCYVQIFSSAPYSPTPTKENGLAR